MRSETLPASASTLRSPRVGTLVLGTRTDWYESKASDDKRHEIHKGKSHVPPRQHSRRAPSVKGSSCPVVMGEVPTGGLPPEETSQRLRLCGASPALHGGEAPR